MHATFSSRIIGELEAQRERIDRALAILCGGQEPAPRARRRKKRKGSWSEKHHALLREWYGKKSDAEIASLLKRSVTAIKSRATVLGIAKGNRKRWTEEEDVLLRELYPHSSDKKVGERFNCSESQVRVRARNLGLQKSAAYMAQFKEESGRRLCRAGRGHRFQKGQAPANKGLRRPGWFSGRMRETQFKKGQRVWNQYPIGAVVQNTDGYLRIKVADDPNAGNGANSKNWEFVHKRVWEAAHGPIPPGHRIWWKDGNHLNCALENLELLSDKEHMARTTIHNLPAPLKEVIQLKGAIRRQITMRSRASA